MLFQVIDLVQVDKKGFVYPDNLIHVVESFFNSAQCAVHDNPLCFRIQTNIIAHPFDVQNLLGINFNEFLVTFHKKTVVLVFFNRLDRLFLNRQKLLGFLNGFRKSFQGYGFQQIVECTLIKGIQCILMISRCVDDCRRMMKHVDKICSADFRHFDVQKDEVNGFILVQKTDEFKHIVAHPR